MNDEKLKFQRGVSRHFLVALIGASAFIAVSCGEKPVGDSAAAAPIANPPLTDKEPSPEEKFSLLLRKAEAGDAGAQAEVASYYEYGGVAGAKDLKAAISWYQKSAEQNNAEAQVALGKIYFYGNDVPNDYPKAFDFYQRAANFGHKDGEYGLATMFAQGKGTKKDAKKAVEWYTKSVNQGHKAAALYLGEMYEFGVGTAKDLATAARYYELAAEGGLQLAFGRIGRMYAHGVGVRKDSLAAAKWFKKAAIRGDLEGQGVLGYLYANGEGLQKDLVLAYAWTNLAAANGEQSNLVNRDLIEKKLSLEEKSEAQRLAAAWQLGKDIERENLSGTVSASVKPASSAMSKRGTGTAFFINSLGNLVTNYHVVDGCNEVRLSGQEGVATVVTTDAVNDLALLKFSNAVKFVAAINSEPSKIRQGEDVVVFGFPLNSVLSSGGNLTPGVISALTGLGNNTNQIQITAPIQPGSSGSPVLNTKGEVVGVVSMKLSDSKMAKATVQVAQNVNFAVSGQTLKSFLDAHKVDYTGSGLLSFNKSTADLADQAKKWTTVIECWK